MNNIVEFEYLNGKRIEKNMIYLKDYLEIEKYFLDEDIKKIKIVSKKRIRKISRKKQLRIFYSIEKLLNAGLSLKKAVEFQEKNIKDKLLKSIYNRIIWKLNIGENIFEVLYSIGILEEFEMIIAYSNENSGRMQDAFLKIRELREKRDELKREIIQNLLYPFFVLFISCFSIILIMIFIVPNFIDIYNSYDKDLPKLTQIIINISSLVKGTFLEGLCSLFFVMIFISFFSKKYCIYLKISFFRKIILQRYILLILECLSLLLKGGVSLDKSIDIILGNFQNYRLKKEFTWLKDLNKGMTFSKLLSKQNILSDIELGIIMIGEESGSIYKSLEEVINYRKEILEKKVKVVLKFLEPVVILVLGIIIGLFVIGLYLPILNMAELII